ncbi:unnamed protein product, partial [Rotaria sp. Silwood2]
MGSCHRKSVVAPLLTPN